MVSPAKEGRDSVEEWGTEMARPVKVPLFVLLPCGVLFPVCLSCHALSHYGVDIINYREIGNERGEPRQSQQEEAADVTVRSRGTHMPAMPAFHAHQSGFNINHICSGALTCSRVHQKT